MLNIPLNCIYLILYVFHVNADDETLKIILQNTTGGDEFAYHMKDSIEIPCTVKSTAEVDNKWFTWLFQPFKNLRYGETENTEGAEDLTYRSVFDIINGNGTWGTSTLYWEASKSGLLWCIYNSKLPLLSEHLSAIVQIYIVSKPTADLAIKVQQGKTIKLMCESHGPYAVEASLHWYFKPSTWSIGDTSDGQDLAQFSEEVRDRSSIPTKRSMKLTFKAEAAGVLECRQEIPGLPTDSTFFNVDVMSASRAVCDECGDCVDVPSEEATTHYEL